MTIPKLAAAVAVIGVASGTVPAALSSPAVSAPAHADPAVARVVYQVGVNHGASNKVMLAAFETCLVESGCRNLPGGDRDSAGAFQQRPSMNWGTYAQVTNVRYAARQFFTRAIAREGCCRTAGQLAQAVQISAYPDRYDEAEGRARALLAAAKRKA